MKETLRRVIAALKPATVRGAVVRLAIAGLVAAGVTVGIDPETATMVFSVVLEIASAMIG